MSDARDHTIGLRLDESELKRLDSVATHYGLTRANVLRMLVKREHDAVSPAPKSADAGPRKRRTVDR